MQPCPVSTLESSFPAGKTGGGEPVSRAEFHTGIRTGYRSVQRDFVTTLQRDLVRVAFALTCDGGHSVILTRQVFVAALTEDGDEDADPQSWSRLLTALGRGYLHDTEKTLAPIPAQPDETDERYQADDERSRLREAFNKFDPRTRAALVLHDLGGLNGRDVAALTGFAPGELDLILERSRERIREASERFSNETAQRLLESLAVDAPRPDLWPQIEPVLEEFEARHRRRTRRIFATTLALLLAAMLASAVWLLDDVPFLGGNDENDPQDDDVAILPSLVATRSSLPSPSATPASTPTSVELIDATVGSDLLIDGLLLHENSRWTGERVMFTFDPRAEQAITEVQAPSYTSRSVSPDGRWTVLFRARYEENLETDDPDDERRITTLSATLDGEDMGWEFELSASVRNWKSAIVGDRLYILSSTPEPATMSALDLETGEVVATRTLEVPRLGLELRAGIIPPPEGSWFIDFGLFVTPDAAEPALYAFVTLSQYGFEIRNQWTRWLYQIELDDLRPRFLSTGSVTAAEASGENDAVNPDFPLWNARVLLDSTGLYALNHVNQQMEIKVLDFESGDIESFSTSFSTVMDYEINRTFLHTINSNDGRKLYVLSDLSGEVAIVDLASRRVERTFPLDSADLRRGPIRAWNLHLSHDGTRLYIVQDMSSYSQSHPPKSHPVWIIDLATWRLEQRLNVPGYIYSLYPDPDGRSLQVVSHVGGHRISGHLRFRLLTYDTRNWEINASLDLSELIDQNATFRLLTLSNTYRDTYGRAPVVDGIEPGDIDDYTTLPRARVVVEDGRVPVGVTRPVELEFLDPATGEPLTRADPRVRYDPDEPVTLVFEQPGAKSLISVPAELGPGHQRGTVRLKQVGSWDARIVAGDEEYGFTLILNDVLRGTPTLEADDGRVYDLRLETFPEEPVPAGELLVRASFVDAVTGEPLPKGVTLVDGLPETLRLTLVGAGALNRNIYTAEHGVYEATITIPDPASWRATIIFRQPDSEETRSIQIVVGTLQIVATTDPTTVSP